MKTQARNKQEIQRRRRKFYFVIATWILILIILGRLFREERKEVQQFDPSSYEWQQKVLGNLLE